MADLSDPEIQKKAREAKERSRDKLEKLGKISVPKGSRLSLAHYLNTKTPPFITMKEAILLRCLDCCGNSAGEVDKCTAPKCPLWPYRNGSGYDIPDQHSWETRRHWNNEWD